MSADQGDPSNSPADGVDTGIKRQVQPCPLCGRHLRRIEGRMGPFWGCSGWPGCKMRLHDVDGRPSEQPDERYRCPVCTRAMVRAERQEQRGEHAAESDGAASSSYYWYCTGYNKGCKVTLNDANGRPAEAWRCPTCRHLLRKRQGKHGPFWGCSQYPLCQETFPDAGDRPRLRVPE